MAASQNMCVFILARQNVGWTLPSRGQVVCIFCKGCRSQFHSFNPKNCMSITKIYCFCYALHLFKSLRKPRPIRTKIYNMLYSWPAVILPMRVWLRLHANQLEPDIAKRLRDNGLASGGDRDAKLQRLHHHYSTRIRVC